MPPADAKEIAHGKGVTGTDGILDITFKAEPDKSIDPASEPIFDFLVTADITDANGETRSASYSVSVAYTAMRADLSGEDWLVAAKPLVIKTHTSTHDGEPLAAEGTLRIHKLKQPKICVRPDPFDNNGPGPFGADYARDADPLEAGAPPSSPDPDKWPLGEVVADKAIKTDKEGKAETTFTLPAGLYRAVFETKDANGRDVQAMLGMQVLAPSEPNFAAPIPFMVRTPSATVQPGEIFTLVWGSGYAESRACVEWYKDATLLKREWSTPGRTQQAFTWKIDESLRGGLSVRVFQSTMNTLAAESITIDVPWKNKELTLTWEHLTSKLLPGAKETWTAVITGPDGAPAPAEMVATLYDASLDAFAPHDFNGFFGLLRQNDGPYFRDEFSCGQDHMRNYVNWTSPDGFYLQQPYRDFIPEVRIFGYARGGGFGGAMPRM